MFLEVNKLSGLDSILGVAKFIASNTSDKINTLNKGIVEVGQINSYSLLQNSWFLSSILSGGNIFYRSHLLAGCITMLVQQNIPVVIFHSNNNVLVDELLRYGNTASLASIDTHSGNYSPFYGLHNDEALDLLMDAIPEKFDVKQNARYYLEAVSDLMRYSRVSRSFNNYLTCPHNTVLDRIDSLVISGRINDGQAQSLRSKIMVGQSEYFKIDSYLHSLSKQMAGAIYNKKSSKKPESIFNTINQNGIISINVGAGYNTLYIDFLIEQIKTAINRGKSFLLVLDSLSLSNSEKTKELIISTRNSVSTIISCDDILSSCGGNEEILLSTIAAAKQFVIFSHSSAASAGKWADVLGEYEKIEQSTSKTNSRSGDGMGFWSMDVENHSQKSRTVTTSRSRDYIIPPERIVSLKQGEFFMRSVAFKGIKHGFLSNM